MKKLLEVVLFCSLIGGLVAAAGYAGHLEAEEEITEARREAKEAKEWAKIVETEAAELVARSRFERTNQTNP